MCTMTDRHKEARKTTCQILLDRYLWRPFLQHVLAGGDTWIRYAPCGKPNCLGAMAKLSLWWDERGVVFYELLKQDEAIGAQRFYQQIYSLQSAIANKSQFYDAHPHWVILLHSNKPRPELYRDILKERHGRYFHNQSYLQI